MVEWERNCTVSANCTGKYIRIYTHGVSSHNHPLNASERYELIKANRANMIKRMKRDEVMYEWRNEKKLNIQYHNVSKKVFEGFCHPRAAF